MSADAFVATWSRPARLRSAANTIIIALPLIPAAATLGWRLSGAISAIIVFCAGILIAVAIAAFRTRAFNQRWLIRQLDTTRPDLEDSADLLIAPENTLNPLQRLQQTRLRTRLETTTAAPLRPGWSTRTITVAWLFGLALTAAALLWPVPDGTAPLLATPTATASGPPQLVSQSLRITPPPYTGLPARSSDRLSTRAPVGARLTWTLRYAPQPAKVTLMPLGSAAIPLTRNGDSWTATRTLTASLLYRINAAGPLHRIDAISDSPPVIRIIYPERTLTPMTRGQQRWPLAFEVSDDHGVSPTTRLRIIVTKGSGETISFTESALTLTGSGDRRAKRFTTSLGIAGLGLTPGNDIVAQLIAADNRSPAPQIVRSPSLILRWPPDLGKESAGMDGMVKTVLPAYFRSQRQVIIDAEALIAQRRRLPVTAFAARSDTIGVDQRALRLRYGQLLGDETSDAPTLPTSDVPVPKPKAPPLEAGHTANDGHDHGPRRAPVFGNAMDVLADYGHAHAEAAGLLDPENARLLRQAVDAMWQSELNLRQGTPEKALPFAYIALRLVKQIQQAERLYLSRTAPEQPPIDLTRRLTGDRKTLGTPSFTPPPRQSGDVDAIPAAAWRTLAGAGDVQIGALQRWATTARTADRLALAAAIDAVVRDPQCQPCRQTLRGALWAAMATPPAQVPRRAAGDAIGRRYLEALR